MADNTFQFDKQFWKKIAVKAIDHIKVRTQKGIDREGKPFPPYSENYAELKQFGFKPTIGGKKAGRVAHKGLSLERQISPPNFRLRGFTMRDLHLFAATAAHAIIGWRGEFAQIVSAHEEKKKYKVGGIEPEFESKLVDEADAYFVNRWNKQKDIEIKVK
jgi:hypothetical protein